VYNDNTSYAAANSFLVLLTHTETKQTERQMEWKLLSKFSPYHLVVWVSPND
jgi:hypothetical protein